MTQASIEVEPISGGNLVFVCGPDHRLSHYTLATPQDLRGERIYIANRSNTPYLWNTVNQFLIANDLSTEALEEMNSPYSMMMMIEAGLGVTVLASNLIAEMGNLAHLHMIKVAGLESFSRLYFAYKKDTDNLCIDNFLQELRSVKQATMPGNVE